MDVELYDFPLNGIHQHTLRLANYCRKRNIPEKRAISLINQKFSEVKQRRPFQPNEVEQAVDKAYHGDFSYSSMQGRHGEDISSGFSKQSPEGHWNNEMPMPPKEFDFSFTKEVIEATPWTLDDMMEDSPLDLSECKTPEIISMIYEPDELVCCGTVKVFETLTAREWLSRPDIAEQVVPNSMRGKEGMNKKGQQSVRCRDATGPRKFLVVESDEKGLSFDDQASVLRCLRDEINAKLKMVVYSGSSSLHGWFESSGNNLTDWDFMNLACKLGADRRMWLPEQLSRSPNAINPKSKKRQVCLYFDPS